MPTIKLETKYRFLADPKLDLLQQVQGVVFTVQYRYWYSPFWKTIGTAGNAEEVTRLISIHKKRVTYV